MDFYDDFEIDSSIDVALADDFLTSIEEDEALEDSDCEEDYDDSNNDGYFDYEAFHKSNLIEKSTDTSTEGNEPATIEIVEEMLDAKGVSGKEKRLELYYYKKIDSLLIDMSLMIKQVNSVLNEMTIQEYYNNEFKSDYNKFSKISALDMTIEDLLP